MTKGEWIREQILFGKYRLLRKLGAGRTGTVWLAVHLGLEEYRAIKCVPKTCADYETFRREALILGELRHPGIPLVYDLEEDQEYSYLVEEYLQGYSLYTLIKNQGTLKEADAVRYGMQICGLVEYIHSVCNIPILYLDLQPNNLIICDDTVKLIDFDHAARSVDANEDQKRYGTVGCAAPEQYTSDHMLDQRTDIYAIGAVLRFMLCGTLKLGGDESHVISEPLNRIIKKCMESDMDRRYASANDVSRALRGLGVVEPEVKCDYKARPSLIVNLAGMRPGAGITHLGFGLLCYLTKQGYETLYEEHNHGHAVRSLALHGKARPDKSGVYYLNGCRMRPWYGPAVHLQQPDGFDVILRDYGTDWEKMVKEAGGEKESLILMATGSPWDRGWTERMLAALGNSRLLDKGRKTVVVFRHIPSGRWGNGTHVPEWEQFLKQAVLFHTPEYVNPFRQQKETETFYRSIWNAVSGSGDSNNVRKGWLKGWTRVKDAFLNAAGIRRADAGSSELPERDAGQE